tara:strand:+ start:1667 stop:1870 length:204 start_codon:yes stop_codon:yes gene_type:complete
MFKIAITNFTKFPFELVLQDIGTDREKEWPVVYVLIVNFILLLDMAFYAFCALSFLYSSAYFISIFL